MKGYIPPKDEEERLFCSRVTELAARCEKIQKPCYIGFLDERQQQLALTRLGGQAWTRHLFFGGLPAAERKVLCVYPAQQEPPAEWEWPITPLRITCADGAKLTHRDYLGSLLGLGLERRCIGDIFPDDAGAWLLAFETQAQLICDELCSVGRSSARAQEDCIPQDVAQQQGECFFATVAQLRLDAVLAAALRQSRQNAAALISAGRVQVSHLTVTQPSAQVDEGDSLTVRGVGKFRLQEVGGQSRKGRIFITIRKY